MKFNIILYCRELSKWHRDDDTLRYFLTRPLSHSPEEKETLPPSKGTARPIFKSTHGEGLWVTYANRPPPGVAFGAFFSADLPLINHLGLTTWPCRTEMD